MIDSQQSDEQILQKYQRDFGKKLCMQKDFIYTLYEHEKNIYSKSQTSCCGKKGLIKCAIITIILNCAGIYFAISRNEGYKALKLVIENNITSIPLNFPDEDEIRRLILFLNNPELYNDIDFDFKNPCIYEDYQQLKCNYGQFVKYCLDNNDHNGQCSNIDFSLYSMNTILYQCIMTDECLDNEVYSHFFEEYGRRIYGIPEKLKYSNENSTVYIYYLRGFTLQKYWSTIGKFDMSVLISSLVFILIYTILLFFDVCNSENQSIGIKYYIKIIGYMILYVALRIFIILYLLLYIYSLFVFFYIPNTYVYDYNYISEYKHPFSVDFYKRKETEDEPTGLWKENRIYAAVFCGINLIIFIFVCVMSSLDKIIYSFLSLNYQNDSQNNNLKGIKRKTSIKICKTYDIEICLKEDLFLIENETDKVYEFKKILYNNEEFYLKITNKGLKDQVDWTDFDRYPRINECFFRLVYLLKFIISAIAISIVFKQIQINDEYTYLFYRHLFELGYQPKYYKYFDKFGDLCKDLSDLIFILYIIIGFLILFPIAKRALFGGFKNIFLSLGSFILSIIFCLFNLAVTIFYVYNMVYLVFSCIFFWSSHKINFYDDPMINVKLIIYLYIYFYSFLTFLIMFICSALLPKCLFTIIIENNILGFSQSRKEEIFKYIGIDQNLYILEVDNSNGLPNNLFYKLKNNDNQLNDNISLIPQKEENKQLCLELNKYDCLKESEQNDYISYIKQRLGRNGLIGNSLYLIIIGGTNFIFMIVAFSTLIKNNKIYKEYSQYLLSLEKTTTYFSTPPNHDYLDSMYRYYNSSSNLPSFASLWCKLAKYESGVLISYFIFLSLYLVFEILSFLHHNKKLHIIDIKKDKINKILILVNIIFYILFMIYFPLLLFLFIYSVLVTFLSPFTFKSEGENENYDKSFEESWNKIENKKIAIVNCVIILIIFILNLQLTNLKYSIIRYINKDYEENSNNNENISNENNNNQNDNDNNINNSEKHNFNNGNDNYYENNNNENNIKIKNIQLIIKNKEYNAHIKLDDNLYLKDIHSDNIYKFKKIKIDNIINEYIYVKLGINSITDQISIGEWDYPIINETFSQLSSLCKQIYVILFLSFPLFQLHVNDENNYVNNISFVKNFDMNRKNKPSFYDIFTTYGLFEKGLNISRFVLNTINLVLFFLLMLYRIYLGGFKKVIFYNITFYICFYLILENISSVICHFLLLIFTGLSISSYYSGFSHLKDDMIQAKLIIQSAFCIPILAINMTILICTIKFCLHINIFRKELNSMINDNIKNPEDRKEIKYISLNGDICTLNEIKDERLQSNLYYRYNLENPNIKPIEANKIVNINNQNKNEMIHIENNDNNSKDLINQ